MERIRTTQLREHIAQRVILRGWMHNLRALGKISFILVRDGYGIAQAVTQDENALSALRGARDESVIEVEGVIVAEAQAPGGVELRDITLRVLAPVTDPPPFPLNKPTVNATLDVFLDHATVGLRHPRKRALLRLSAGIMRAFREFLDGEGFTEIQSPKLVASATESGANVFAVDYFGKRAFLAQSPQFYKQIMVGVFERVYEVGPVFRAEPHDTTRHTNEYVSLDAEFGFIENHFTVMALLTRVIRHILARLAERHAAELELLDVKMPMLNVIASPAGAKQSPINLGIDSSPTPLLAMTGVELFPHLHFRDAQQLIFEKYGEDCRGEPDLAPQHERWLGQWARATYASDFLFVIGYPMSKRPFYTHPDPADPKYSYSFDLLFRGTELVTGGQRLHRHADYLAALARAGYPLEPFAHYLEAMKYGMPPHGGFAIGLERFVMQLCGLSNLREATLFPRDTHRLTP
ncbi:MAG: aspartate--tRNA ligase [Chloroflexi bacterium]|nr:aspartate--tRNA ligase [Chloroflexota bacterium]